MRTGDESLLWLKEYFDAIPQYLVTLKMYGPNVPSNHIEVQGSGWFRLTYCPSWPAPQVNCTLTPSNLNILNDVLDNISVREMGW